MDVELTRTFLEVAASGSFIAAAQRLHLTQTAVSARIRTLEHHLGLPLFVRNKAGARLTPAGERFMRYATSLVQAWERAHHHVALPPGREAGIGIGAESSLWHPLLADWLVWMHRVCPEVALRVTIDSPAQLLEAVQDGALDLALVYSPAQRPGLVCELLMDEKLILVTTSADGAMQPSQYVYVDWGPAFAANHDGAFPALANPPVSMSLGPLALGYLLAVGGCGYFRASAVRALLAEGRLQRVAGAPEFSHSAYAVYASRHEHETLARARDGLRLIAADQERQAPQPPIELRRRASPAGATRAPRRAKRS